MEPEATAVRVRYPETDRMGLAHHTHYLVWFELGRTELMRRAGVPYGELEDSSGLFFPVVELGARFLQPAVYDEELEIRTVLSRVGGATVRFDYELFRSDRTGPLAVGHTVHAAVDREGRPRRIPSEVRQRLEAP
jgi:acyl-CoA thioester hydrolase